MTQHSSDSGKKVYRKPDLRDYGDVRDITLNATDQGNIDKGVNKT